MKAATMTKTVNACVEHGCRVDAPEPASKTKCQEIQRLALDLQDRLRALALRTGDVPAEENAPEPATPDHLMGRLQTILMTLGRCSGWLAQCEPVI